MLHVIIYLAKFLIFMSQKLKQTNKDFKNLSDSITRDEIQSKAGLLDSYFR